MGMFLGGTLCLLLTLRKEKREKRGQAPFFKEEGHFLQERGQSLSFLNIRTERDSPRRKSP